MPETGSGLQNTFDALMRDFRYGMRTLAVATIACLVPAWRASRLDPMEALRTE